MTPPPTARFAKWLSHAQAHRQGKTFDSPSFAITLSPDFGGETVRLAENLVEYLNEFDETDAGGWEVFDKEALHLINPHNAVEALPDWVKHPPGPLHRDTPDGGSEPLVYGMARLGMVVLVENQAHITTQAIPRVFHVRLTHQDSKVPEADARPFHLLLNRTRFGPDSLVSIIGDCALEWANRGHDPINRIVRFMNEE